MTCQRTMDEPEKQTEDISACLAGHRLTSQRLLLLGLLRQGEHLEADELYRRAREKEPRLSMSTVYRNLQLFLKLGLAEEHHFDGACSCYEIKTGAPHHHLRCLGCGNITDFEYPLSPEIKEDVENRHGFHATGIKVLLVGYCADCFQRKESTA